MKAVRISSTGGPEVLEYVDVEAPSPGPGQVIVRTESISVNYADVMIREGTYPVMPPLPTPLGLEAAGVVEEMGDGVEGVRPGQRVSFITLGSYAERVAVDAQALIPLPDDVDFDAGAAFPVVYLSAYHLLHTVGNVKEGDWVLLYAAAGGVGTAVTQLARVDGLNVIGLTSTEEKVRRATSMGADHVLRYDQPDLVERVLDLTGGRGVNLILDSVAGPSFPRNFDMAAPLGRIIWFGFTAGLPPELLGSFAQNFVKGIGVQTFHLTYSIAEPYPELLMSSVGTLLGHLQERRIEPVIHDHIPLSDVAKAHQLLESRTTVGKLILKP